MTKYTRSMRELTETIKDIFAMDDISLDTRAIVLFLAGTMTVHDFSIWLGGIPQLYTLNTKFTTINKLRNQYGDIYRDYIMLSVFQAVDHDINTEELQGLIYANAHQAPYELLYNTIEPALSVDLIKTHNSYDAPTTATNFVAVKQQAVKYLLQKLDRTNVTKLTPLLDAYLFCRQSTTPIVAYQALVHSIADILTATGVCVPDALLCGHKLASHALEYFIHNSQSPKAILPIYNKDCSA